MDNLGVFIPILIFLIPIIAIWTSHQQKMAKLRTEQPAVDARASAAQDDQLRALEARVKVLERIVPDANQGTALAAQIDALRDDAGTPLAFEKERV